jgi:hypothetical protein
VAQWLERDYVPRSALLFPEAEAENKAAAAKVAQVLNKRARSARSSPCVSMRPELADWLGGFWLCLFMGWPGHSTSSPPGALYALARGCYEAVSKRAGRHRVARDEQRRLAQLADESRINHLSQAQWDREVEERIDRRRHVLRMQYRERFDAWVDRIRAAGHTLLTFPDNDPPPEIKSP